MTVYKYGKEESSVILIQPVGDHDINLMEEEAVAIKRLTKMDFGLFAVKVDNWNADLSPWQAPAVFGNEAFGDGAAHTLDVILQLCLDKERKYYIGGYSLAGFLPCGHRIRPKCLQEPLQLLHPCGSRDFFLI